MVMKPKNDTEAINRILEEVYDEELIPYYFDDVSVAILFVDSYAHELARIIRKMLKLDLIYIDAKNKNLYQISDHAREIIQDYGSYSNYILQDLDIKKKEDKKIVFDRLIKNGNIMAALLISTLSLVLSQFPIGNKKRQQKIEQGIESLAKQLDSLKQELHNTPKQLPNNTTQRTASDK